MVKQYAVIDNTNTCINIILWDEELHLYTPPDGSTLIQDDTIVIGTKIKTISSDTEVVA